MGERSAGLGQQDAGDGAGQDEIELDENGQGQDWRHLPVTLSGDLMGVMVCTKPPMKKPESPLELFCHEQQRHERIAFMMRGDEHVSKWPIDAHNTRGGQPTFQTQPHNRFQHEDTLMKDAGEAAAANSKHSSSPFQVKLEVNGSDNMEEDPHLEEIRIAARIK
ncbi:hypothetical protein J7T55_002875 [Diaporthe amygdali]|uniref:uncharacterized protein n=1 Tax=Phomopsis amygdali TaxID=1214568 RepID=UPI0022FE90F6|nr:uncharacterized protein J7T55_002875 [Diaporthe amygdali]KAJ0122362.1 hypothetical protein J7T55_002875 [Diaporthe amygdali]